MKRAFSLSGRLLWFSGGLVAAAMVAAWMVLGILFERHVERQFQAELERNGLALIGALSVGADGRPVLMAKALDPRFERPASGLYWRVSGPNGLVLQSRSLWDGSLPAASRSDAGQWRSHNGEGPFEERVMVAGRDVRLAGLPYFIKVEVAGDREPLLKARRAFGLEAGAFLLVLGAGLSLAAWGQVQLGLAPLKRVRREVETLQKAAGARLDSGDHPVEILPLTEAINALAQARALDLERARRQAADLAHALKTPLTALRLQIEEIAPIQADQVDGLRSSLAMVSSAVEAELARAERLEGGRVLIAPVVARIVAVIRLTPEGQERVFLNQIPADLYLPMHEEVALEVIGALIENAARFASATVRVSGGAESGGSWLRIEDDGPGVPEAMRAVLLDRGRRLDQRPGGQGLGLSIARDHVEASGGSITLGVSALGGLDVDLKW